ncbi:hypothetical protein RvY_01307-2 [Ramazzottius varieornatus]|uniref:Uncharacterized protein n=1 Tax=Ramazzottius varieornatus TaxID=947166 RepID=A0A1D1UG89_RAMVA|nr:hypothetical protein RvY_01307-2 [Ramazzottius varieornatus]
MGFSHDLPNKNLAEAEHKALEAFFGKHKDLKEVAERLLKMYADQLTHLFQCMKNQGKYRVREEFAKDLLLSRKGAHDERHIVAKLKNMFPKIRRAGDGAHCNPAPGSSR